jgi:hypothetical protein
MPYGTERKPSHLRTSHESHYEAVGQDEISLERRIASMAEKSHELILKVLGLSLSANGEPALWLVVPVSILLLAAAYRLIRR